MLQGEVQKLLTILEEDLDEEDLRNVLLECLKDAPVPVRAGQEPLMSPGTFSLKISPISTITEASTHSPTQALYA